MFLISSWQLLFKMGPFFFFLDEATVDLLSRNTITHHIACKLRPDLPLCWHYVTFYRGACTWLLCVLPCCLTGAWMVMAVWETTGESCSLTLVWGQFDCSLLFLVYSRFRKWELTPYCVSEDNIYPETVRWLCTAFSDACCFVLFS